MDRFIINSERAYFCGLGPKRGIHQDETKVFEGLLQVFRIRDRKLPDFFKAPLGHEEHSRIFT
jgi:hypothetical protein